MRESARKAMIAYNEPLEGSVPFMYLDQLGLVTTAIGVLVDPIGLVYGLPFKDPDTGLQASANDIALDWSRVKLRQDLKMRGGMAYKNIARLRLDKRGIEQVTFRKLDTMLRSLRSRFPEWDTWPADAQLGIVSLAWACGPAFRFPKLATHLANRDWAAAEGEISIARDHGTINKRNEWQKLCMRNAAAVEAAGADPDVLHWPNEAPKFSTDSPIGGGMLAIEGVVDATLEARKSELDG